MVQKKPTRTASSTKRVSKPSESRQAAPSAEPTVTPEETVEESEGQEAPEEETVTTETGSDDQDDTPEGDDEGTQDDEDGEEGDEDAENAPQTADQPEGAPVDPQDPETASTEQEDGPKEGESATYEPAPRQHSAAPKGKIIKKGEPVSFEAHEMGNTIVVDEDVYLEVTARGSDRKTYRLMYRQGTTLPKTAVKQTA